MSTPKRRSGIRTGVSTPPIALYKGVVGRFFSSSTSPLAAEGLDALRADDFSKLLEMTELQSPQMYGSSSSYLDDAQVVALIKKYPFSENEIPGLKPEETAIKKFLASEHRCKRVNQRCRAKRRRFDHNAQFWHYARTYIERTIGPKPDLEAICRLCDFTAGASMGVHGNATNLARKLYAKTWSCTPTALPYAMTALWLNVHARDCILPGTVKCYDPDLFRDLVRRKVELTSCNNITFVPKTAKTHRSIAVEPLLNGFVQKGIDVYLRRCLAKVNINLQDQTPNQALAFAGSLENSVNPYCTIDLASASDSLAIEVVRDLVPPEWFDFLADIRAPRYNLHGQDYHYEKFCSMGNGFCFPLQTLIFASVCYAALRICGDNVRSFAVYGDDIVVPQNVALLVIERLRDLGFSINRDKTFITGPFRESCGRDWFQGRDVRPVSLDKPLDDIRQLCAFHNGTYRSAYVEDLFHEVRQYLRSFRPALLRPGKEPGDTCFSVPLDLAMTSPWVRWRRDTYSWAWREIVSRSVSDRLSLSVEEHANALCYAVLRGSDSHKAFTLRYSTTPKYRPVSRPFWEKVWTYFGDGGPIVLGNRPSSVPSTGWGD